MSKHRETMAAEAAELTFEIEAEVSALLEKLGPRAEAMGLRLSVSAGLLCGCAGCRMAAELVEAGPAELVH